MSHSATTGAAQAAAAAPIAHRPSAAVPLLLGPKPSPAPPAAPTPPSSPPRLLFSPSLPAARAVSRLTGTRVDPTQLRCQDTVPSLQSRGAALLHTQHKGPCAACRTHFRACGTSPASNRCLLSMCRKWALAHKQSRVTGAHCQPARQLTPTRLRAHATCSPGRPPGAGDQGGQAAAQRGQRGRKRGAQTPRGWRAAQQARRQQQPQALRRPQRVEQPARARPRAVSGSGGPRGRVRAIASLFVSTLGARSRPQRGEQPLR